MLIYYEQGLGQGALLGAQAGAGGPLERAERGVLRL